MNKWLSSIGICDLVVFWNTYLKYSRGYIGVLLDDFIKEILIKY